MRCTLSMPYTNRQTTNIPLVFIRQNQQLNTYRCQRVRSWRVRKFPHKDAVHSTETFPSDSFSSLSLIASTYRNKVKRLPKFCDWNKENIKNENTWKGCERYMRNEKEVKISPQSQSKHLHSQMGKKTKRKKEQKNRTGEEVVFVQRCPWVLPCRGGNTDGQTRRNMASGSEWHSLTRHLHTSHIIHHIGHKELGGK